MAYTRTNRKYFERPRVAKRYRNVEAMMIDSRGDLLERENVDVPAAGKIRAIAFGVYDEPGNKPDPQTNVITSGTVVMIGGTSSARDRIGVLSQDCIEGDVVPAYTSGTFFFPLDYKGDAAASPARVAASELGSLNGKIAYWLRDLGKVTDQKPASGGQAYLAIGTFVDVSAERQPEGCYWDHKFAAVKLQYIYGQTGIAEPSAASIAHTAGIDVFPSVSSFGGLTVDFTVNASSTDPEKVYVDSEISTVLDAAGANVTKTGNQFSYTFGTAGTKTVDITVGGTTFNYEVVVHATNAPSIAHPFGIKSDEFTLENERSLCKTVSRKMAGKRKTRL